MKSTQNLRVKQIKPLASPSLILSELPITENAAKTIIDARASMEKIFSGEDKRLLVVIGPCSIHDPELAMEYAKKLKTLADKFADKLFIVMRVYFEKPRTTVGWKGLINDPDLNGSFNIGKGLRTARQVLLDVNELGLPAATEFLDTIIPQYISDLISWAAIGARTTESQIHREMASGLSMPIGFKNGTGGSVQIAADAVYSASQPHRFLGVTSDGLAAIVETEGNPYSHIILRGSSQGTNFDKESVADAMGRLAKSNQRQHVMIDTSHGNSQKDHNKQILVVEDIAARVKAGEEGILGLMIESHINPGNQKMEPGVELAHGVSVTDKCIGWEDTEKVITLLADAVQN